LRSKNVAVDILAARHDFMACLAAGVLDAGKRLIDQVGTALRDALDRLAERGCVTLAWFAFALRLEQII